MRNTLIGLFVLVLSIFIIWYFIDKKNDKPLRLLSYFGTKAVMKANDTIYHKVGPFSFIDQYNSKVSDADLEGKIYVVDYFFTTCKSICPIMNMELTRVHKEFKDKPDFMILSHTVDPETDSVPQLAEHAKKYGVTDKKWLFVTGAKKELYEMARKSYLLNTEEGNGGEEDFIHTQNFALIDKEKHIRGFYNGTDSVDVSRLITDIKTLFKEYDFKNKDTH